MRDLQKNTLVVSHQTLRRFIGFFCLLLPVGLIGGGWLETQRFLPSLSMYYHSGFRDFFVAGFAAVGVFLLCYSGYPRQKRQLLTDGLMARLAGLGVLGMVFFPIPIDGFSLNACVSGNLVALSECGHYGFSGLFYLSMLVFSLMLFRRKADKSSPVAPRKSRRNRFFLRSGAFALMATAMTVAFFALPAATTAPAVQYNPLLWLQSSALMAIGLAWFAKGGGLRWMNDKKSANPVMKDEKALAKLNRKQARAMAAKAEQETIELPPIEVKPQKVKPREDKAA